MHKTKKLDSSWAIHQNTHSFQAVLLLIYTKRFYE